jgi:hypothetical protein
LKVDSVVFPSPTVANCYVRYVGLLNPNAYVRIFCNGTFSDAFFITAGNGNFMITISGLTPGTTYLFIPKITSPFVFDGTSGVFTTPTCSFSPTPTITPFGTVSACSGLALTANPSGAIYQWKKDGVNILGATTMTHSAIISGIYTCDITSGGCTMTTAGTTVNIVGSIGLHIGFSDTTVCDSSTIELLTSVDNPTNVSYSWSPTTGLDNPFSSSPMAFVTSPETYVVTVDNGSCVETSSITVIPVSKPQTSYADKLTNGFMLTGSYPGKISSVLVAGNILSPKPEYNTTTYAVFDYSGLIMPNDLIIIKTVSSECSETWKFLFTGIEEIQMSESYKNLPIYNLYGQKVEGPLVPFTLYVLGNKNGKKFMVTQ